MKRDGKKTTFDLGFSKKKEDLTIRLLNGQRKRLAEIAADLTKQERRNISVSRLVQAAIRHHIKNDGEVAVSNLGKTARAGAPATKDEFDLGLSDIGSPLQVLLPQEQIEALDQIAERQNKDRSVVVREAVDFLINFYDREGHL